MKYIILGHENPDVDSVLSGILFERIFNRKFNSNKFKFIIPDNEVDEITTKIVSDLGIDINNYMCKDIDLDDELVLVDHYEDNRYTNKIKAIYDHHPTIPGNEPGNIETYYNLKSCSTTCVLAKLFEEDLTKDDLLLVLIGALVDTVSFKSTKTNYSEVEFLERKCREYSIDINKYKDIGLCLNDITNPQESYLYGLKKYTIHDKKVESSYIQIKDVKHNRNKLILMLFYIKQYMEQNNIDIFVFIVHDMDNFKTTSYELTKDKMEDITEYDSYTSRGSTIIPELSNKILKLKKD
jgi:inorganic pyrophosphatase/exopolyphosphatase